LLTEESNFLRLNCLKIFFRCGLFFDHFFPFVGSDEWKAAQENFICYHPRSSNVLQKNSIKVTYKLLFTKNKDFVSTYPGSSSYGEVTESGVNLIIDTIQKTLLPLLSTQERRTFRMIDVGAGVGTTILHIAQKIHGQYAGIENDPIRCRFFGDSYKELLQDDCQVGNTNLAYLFKDLNEVRNYDFDIVYSFDEVFPLSDWRELVRTFLSSKRAKFFISFKPCKCKQGSNDLIEELVSSGLVLKTTLKVKMKISGEVSNAGVFIKQSFLDSKVSATKYFFPLDEEWEKCLGFWSPEKEEKLAAINNLLEDLNFHLTTELHERKHKKARME